MRSVLRILILALGFGFVPLAHAANAVQMEGDPGDFIVGDQTLTYEEGGFTYSASTSQVIVNAGSQIFGGYNLEFAVPRGTSFAVPGSYGGATGNPFSPTKPGLSVSGNGRACNRSSGAFEVLEAKFDGSGKVLKLAIDFVQHCELQSSALYGAVRINSDIPLQRSGPHVYVEKKLFVYGNDTVDLDAGGSYSRQSKTNLPLQYLWTQTDGRHVDLQNADQSKVEFTAPFVAPGGEILKFNLTVTDGNGQSSVSPVAVSVLSKSDPQTAIYLNSPDGDYVGQGSSVRFTPADGDFTLDGDKSGGTLGFYGGAEAFASLTFAAPQGQELAVGPYENAQRAADADPGRPGMDVSANGRSCSAINGRFDVRQFVIPRAITPSNLPHLRIDFEQHCGTGAPPLTGTAMFNYLAPGIPVARARIDSDVSAGQVVNLDGRASSDDKAIVGYHWRQLSGPSVTLTGGDTSMASFVMPTLQSGVALKFQLLVVDGDELTAVDTAQIANGEKSGGSSGGGAMSPWILLLGLGLWTLRRQRALN